MNSENGKYIRDDVELLATELYSFLAQRFPVCCASDEFTFFPQAVNENPDWNAWDDFSPDAVSEAVIRLNSYEDRLVEVSKALHDAFSPSSVNVRMLSRVIRTLIEQLDKIGTHTFQPTFYLTIATVGLIHAMDTDDPEAWGKRIRTLPRFLENSLKALGTVPLLFKEQGIEMGTQFRDWLISLEGLAGIENAVQALGKFKKRLMSHDVVDNFTPTPDHLDRIVNFHMSTGLSVSEVLMELEEEATEMLSVMEREARILGHGSDWKEALSRISHEPLPRDGKTGLIEREVERLRNHCVKLGITYQGEAGAESGKGELKIVDLPGSLQSVRTADSYNAKPGHPFSGGTFFIYGGSGLGTSVNTINPVYRMTAAHEAYPGHHLLDMSRWNNPDPVRRPVEYPLFYEGWACFAEDLMLLTGAFERPYDTLMLAMRRYRHAVRGKADLMLQTGKTDIKGTAAILSGVGLSKKRAVDTARKYALRPGYQLCYTVGRRRFSDLLASSAGGRVPEFAQTVLLEGEIGLGDLEHILKKKSTQKPGFRSQK